MALKDLLVLGGAGTQAAVTYGVWLSGVTGAFLTGAIPVIQPSFPPGLIAELPDDLVSRVRDEAADDATRAAQEFADAARDNAIQTDVIKFDATAGDIGYSFSRLARCFDACILPQPDPNGLYTTSIVEAALFGSGRPLLAVPYIYVGQHIKTVLIAWDGGVQAARAASDAMPLLKYAEQVQIVTVSKEEKRPHYSGRDLSRHLARHNIDTTVRTLPDEEIDVASMILSYAADHGADLIVMGGYGHSRLRELILGGTTREILRSMTVPVLLSH
ncbi:universal stress protein [Microvirga terrestris]|uniref:Universal stress protein n=1 Tax=Microvirga terrestris TaxID=2791024 RepID=A0ABS0HTX8_9HYPH|nr:universal stress protein [Microvirga terrestris]MBF9196948.1 universal stress protein [Microvirga terrestris]